MGYTSKLAESTVIEVATADNVFQPTYTSELCIRTARETFRKPCTLLDLGCGCGLVGLALAKLGCAIPPLYASDVSEHATRLAKENAELLGVELDVRTGSVFEPWSGMRFDGIVDDVSGMAEDVARISPWYAKGIPCSAGPDGTDLTFRVLDEAHRHLTEQGVLLFPIISLSATSKVLQRARERFMVVEKVAGQPWKLPDEMFTHLEFLRSAKREGRVDFSERFGMVLCETEVYRCSEAR